MERRIIFGIGDWAPCRVFGSDDGRARHASYWARREMRVTDELGGYGGLVFTMLEYLPMLFSHHDSDMAEYTWSENNVCSMIIQAVTAIHLHIYIFRIIVIISIGVFTNLQCSTHTIKLSSSPSILACALRTK